MIDRDAWNDYQAQRLALGQRFKARHTELTDKDEREANWEAFHAEVAALRQKFGVTWAACDFKATEYQVSIFTEEEDPEGYIGLSAWALKVAYRGRDRWAVLHHGLCLSTTGTWDYESSPTNREDEFLATHRFGFREALDLAEKAAPDITVNGRTAAEIKIELSMKENTDDPQDAQP